MGTQTPFLGGHKTLRLVFSEAASQPMAQIRECRLKDIGEKVDLFTESNNCNF